jgi:hypothetical protein
VASAVDICNEALSHLGDSATVSSIDPPEGSAQAEHCARFYPTCLAALLEMHPWSFATRRIALAMVTNPSSGWSYAYAIPSDQVNTIAVLAADAPDDYSAPGRVSSQSDVTPYYSGVRVAGSYTPQDYATEGNIDGVEILLTNQIDAVLRYTALVTDVTKFTPLFRKTLAWFLAAELAGPLIKGDSGRSTALSCTKVALSWLAVAKDSDASNRQSKPQHQVSWLNART